MMRPLWLLLLCGLLLGHLGCKGPAGERVSDDPRLQLKYEVAQRNLGEIRARQERGEDIAGDCQAIRMLFLEDLGRIDHPAAKRVARGLRAVCASARRP